MKQSITNIPDALFTSAEQIRLSELMEKWRKARDGQATLLPSELRELKLLVDTEFRAATERTALMLQSVEP